MQTIYLSSQVELTNFIMRKIVKTDKIESQDKYLLLMVSSFVNKENDWWCYPSVARLAEWSLMSQATVKRAMKRLVESGLLIRVRDNETNAKKDDSYKLKSNSYKIDIERLGDVVGVAVKYSGSSKPKPVSTTKSKYTPKTFADECDLDPCDLIDAPF